jgi:hypothetical protein
VFSQASKLIWIKKEKASHKGGHQNQRESREDPPNPSGEEIDKAKGILRKTTPNYPADEKAGDNKKDVNTNKTPGQSGGEYVVHDHTGHRHGSESIDVAAVVRTGGTIFF